MLAVARRWALGRELLGGTCRVLPIYDNPSPIWALQRQKTAPCYNDETRGCFFDEDRSNAVFAQPSQMVVI